MSQNVTKLSHFYHVVVKVIFLLYQLPINIFLPSPGAIKKTRAENIVAIFYSNYFQRAFCNDAYGKQGCAMALIMQISIR